MSDFDPAEQIVTAKQLAHAFDETPAQIVALTRLGILRPLHVSEKSLTSEARYEFLGTCARTCVTGALRGSLQGVLNPEQTSLLA